MRSIHTHTAHPGLVVTACMIPPVAEDAPWTVDMADGAKHTLVSLVATGYDAARREVCGLALNYLTEATA